MGLFDFIEHLIGGKMDYVGQGRANILQYMLMYGSGAVAFVYGFLTQSYLNTFRIIFATYVLTVLVTVPSWPFWNRNPVIFADQQKKSN
jgi:signal peptidase complex subunit 1